MLCSPRDAGPVRLCSLFASRWGCSAPPGGYLSSEVLGLPAPYPMEGVSDSGGGCRAAPFPWVDAELGGVILARELGWDGLMFSAPQLSQRGAHPAAPLAPHWEG